MWSSPRTSRPLKDQLHALLPLASIEALSLNGAIVLRGRVPSTIVAEQAMQVAAPYGTKVLNLMEVAGVEQVMLQVRFAEVSRSASSALGVNFGYSDGRSFGASNVGQVNPLGIKEFKNESSGLAIVSPNPSISLFGSAGRGRFGAGLLHQRPFARTTCCASSLSPISSPPAAREASFLAGGEFPIPVTQSGGSGGNSISIEYREFGVRLNFTPQVLGDGRIRLKVAPEVSDLDFTTSVRLNGFVVPGLTSRKVTTTIELGEGQTFAIAGPPQQQRHGHEGRDSGAGRHSGAGRALPVGCVISGRKLSLWSSSRRGSSPP